MIIKRPESVLVLVFSYNGNVLLLQRDDDPAFWQSVTGTIEIGETPIQTAYREIAEEIGINCEETKSQINDCRWINQYKIREQWLSRYPKGSQYNTEYVFSLCIDETAKIQLTEHTQYRWLSKQAAIEKAWSMSNREGIAKFVPERSCK